MELRESIKDDVKQELKYILHSQKTRKEIQIVGNLKSIQCSISYPFFQLGKLVNYKVYFNIVLCLLSNGTILPPLVLTTVDNSTTGNETPVLKVRTNVTQLSFRNWLRSVWRKRSRYNVSSLLVTNTRLPLRAAELLKKYNTQLVILPDIITADTEPLDEVWCNELMGEISNCFTVWNQEFITNMLPLDTFCKIISSAWMKCSIAANFDKLFLLDEDRAIANILEDQFIHQKQWMRKATVTAQEAKLKYEIFYVLRCSSCDNLFHIEEWGEHALNEATALGRKMFPKFRRLVGIGGETYFTCFKDHGDGRLICEICAEVFSREFLAAYHTLKHLQQKWCRVCFKQIFVCQEHICLQNDSELSVFAQEEAILAPKDQRLESNQRMLSEGSSTDSGQLLFTQDQDAYVVLAPEDQHLESHQRMLSEGSSTESAQLLFTQDQDAYVAILAPEDQHLESDQRMSSEGSSAESAKLLLTQDQDAYIGILAPKDQHLKSNQRMSSEGLSAESAKLLLTQDQDVYIGIPVPEGQHLESNQRMLSEGSSTDSAQLLFAQDKDANVENVSNDLEELPLVEKQSSENTEGFNLSVRNEVCNSDVQSFPIQKCHKLEGAEKHRHSEYEDENTYTLALKYLSSPKMPVNNATNAETSQNDIDSNSLICDIQAENSSENLVSGLRKASCGSMYFQLLEIISENEDYFLNENVSSECSINPDFFHTPVVSIEETPAPR